MEQIEKKPITTTSGPTPSQQDAMNASGGAVIVSAAAGSGKTFVLIERVIRMITDPDPARRVDVDRLLIVTYTRAAAAELRERLYRALSECIKQNPSDTGLLRQQMLLPKANIATVDSFCHTLVSEYFYLLDIDRDFRVAESGELSVLTADAMRLTLDALYTERNEDFHSLVETFASARDDKMLEQYILRLYNFVRSHPFPDRWMAEKLSAFTGFQSVYGSVWGGIIADYTKDILGYMERLHDRFSAAIASDDEVYRKNVHNERCDSDFLDNLKAAVENERWDGVCAALNGYAPSSFSTPKGYKGSPVTTEAMAARNAFKEMKKKLSELYASDESECHYYITRLESNARQLFKAAQLFSENFALLKKQKGVADFSDLEHWALELLVDENTMQHTALAKEISARFSEIMVDEYQDANETQDAIFSALSDEEKNLFVVGDVKQSIYRFRQAMPELFLRRKNNSFLYHREDPLFPAKIILEKNFRSEKSILAAVNYCFVKLMSPALGEIDYNEEEMLYPGAVYDEPSEPSVEFRLIDREATGEDSAVLAEARRIAETIHAMIASGYIVQTKEGKRPIEFGDFAVLLRKSTNKAPLYMEVLSRYGIPTHSEKKGGFLTAPEIMLMTNFLRVINNPALDIELLSVAMSPVYAFSESDFARIRVHQPYGSLYAAVTLDAQNGNQKSARFIEELRTYRELSVTVPLSRLISILYERTSFVSVMSAVDVSATARNNLRVLLDYARSFEQNTHRGLSAFVGYLDRLTENGSDLNAAARENDTGDVGVQVMSMHSSKGLEFPVCFLADTASEFTSDKAKPVLLHPEYGYAQRYFDRQNSVYYKTMPYQALSLEVERSEKSEELRILYVAMTRARQKLIILATPWRSDVRGYLKNVAKKMGAEGMLSPFAVRSATSMSEWLTMCALLHPDGETLRRYAELEIEHDTKADFTLDCRIEDEPLLLDADEEDAEQQQKDERSYITEILQRHADFRYPYEGLGGVPVKVAASNLAHRDADKSYDRYLARPVFMSDEKLTSAEKGTALHLFMQFADFSAARRDIFAERDRLCREGRITKTQAQSIDMERAQRFFSGELVTRCLNASEVYKEYRFNVKIPASRVDPSLDEKFSEESVILQGAVDLAFVEDGELVIVDYKTDRVKRPEELRDRYATQLLLYKDAMRQCLGLPVKECIIYSVRHGKEIKV